MKNIYSYSLTILCLYIITSCTEKTKKVSLSEAFQDKIWFVDSTVAPSGGQLTGEVLKPVHDSIFDIYREQSVTFEAFKIKGDTISIRRSGDWKDFRVKESTETAMSLIALDSSQTLFLQT